VAGDQLSKYAAGCDREVGQVVCGRRASFKRDVQEISAGAQGWDARPDRWVISYPRQRGRAE
jgi:hypothetical protein